MLFRKEMVSLETASGEGKDRAQEDSVSDIHTLSLEKEQNSIFKLEIEEEEKSILMEEVCAEVWTRLSDREKKIMLLRNRTDDPGEQSSEKDVQEASATRERVRQVEAKIVQCMRRSLERRKLRGRLGDDG